MTARLALLLLWTRFHITALCHELRQAEKLVAAGFRVKVVATQAALYFFDAASLTKSPAKRGSRDPEVVVLDEDEWFRTKRDERYQRDDPVLHIVRKKA
jgi:hypothetical protein